MLIPQRRGGDVLSVPAAVQVRLLPATEVSAAASIWTGLEAHHGGRPAVSWAWTRSWLRHYGDAVAARFAVVERGAEPVGVVLLAVSRRRAIGTRRLHLGTAGEPDGEGVYVEYNDVLCAPVDRPMVLAAVLRAVREQPGWDELVAPGLRPSAAADLRAALPVEESAAASWTMRLDPDRPALAGLKGSVRRLVRQARETLHPAAPELVRGAAARTVMAEMTRLHQRRWNAAGRPGVLASPRLSGFLADLVDAWLDERHLLLLRLPDERGATLGCVVGFVEDDRFLYYQGGFQRYPDNRKRAGLLCHVEFAELCRRRGLREYELLCGDARYKRQLGNGEHNTLFWSSYRRPTARNAALDLARRALAAARRQ